MSGRLDQSLDSIIDSQKKAKRDTQRRRKPVGTKARAAPVGGVKKATKPVKSAVKPAGGASAPTQPSKIVVSGLVRNSVLFASTQLTVSSPTTSMRPRSRYVDEEACVLGFLSPCACHFSVAPPTRRSRGDFCVVRMRITRSYCHAETLVRGVETNFSRK
jgi:hypothetical protein